MFRNLFTRPDLFQPAPATPTPPSDARLRILCRLAHLGAATLDDMNRLSFALIEELVGERLLAAQVSEFALLLSLTAQGRRQLRDSPTARSLDSLVNLASLRSCVGNAVHDLGWEVLRAHHPAAIRAKAIPRSWAGTR